MSAHEKPVDPDSPAGRLRALRRAAQYPSMDNFAIAHDIPVSTYRAHENGTRGIKKAVAQKYADILKSSAPWIILGIGAPHPPMDDVSKNEKMPLDTSAIVGNDKASSRDQTANRPPVNQARLPIFSSERGPGGGFVMSATPAKYVSMPARLSGIQDPRALYMVGDDMFPRVKHGELIFPHPHELPLPESIVIIVFKRKPQEWIARDLVLDDGGERVVVRRYGKGNANGTEEIICRSEILKIEATVSPTYFG